MSEFMIIPGSHPLAQYIHRDDSGVLTVAAVAALDVPPDNYDVDRLDIVVRHGVLQSLLRPFLFVQPEAFGLNSMFRWWCTQAKLRVVLQFVGELADDTDNERFYLMTRDSDDSVIPLPLGNLAYVLDTLAFLHDEASPEDPLSDMPQLQLANEDYLLVPDLTAAELADDPQAVRWDLSHNGGAALDEHYGTLAWRGAFIGAFTLEALIELAPSRTDADRLYQYLMSAVTSPGVGSPPVVMLRSLHSLLKSTVFGADLMAWADMLVSIDGRTAALDIAGALLQALGALPIELCPLPILPNHTRIYLKAAMETTKQSSTYGMKQLMSHCSKGFVESSASMFALFADVRLDHVSFLLALDDMASAVDLAAPISMAEARRVTVLVGKLQENLILQESLAPAALRSAVMHYAAQSDVRTSSASSAGSTAASGPNFSSQDSSGFMPSINSAADVDDLVQASIDGEGVLTSNPHDVFTFLRTSEAAGPGCHNAFRVLLAYPQLFAGGYTMAARLFQSLTPFTTANCVKTLALFDPVAGSPRPPWLFTPASTPRLDVAPKTMNSIMMGKFDKLDVMALASQLVAAQHNMFAAKDVVKYEPKLTLPLFSSPAHAAIYCATLAAAIEAGGFQQGPYGTNWLFDVISRNQSGLRGLQPSPADFALISQRFVVGISSEVSNFNALSKKAKLLASPVVGGALPEAAALVPGMEERGKRRQQRVQDGEIPLICEDAPLDASLIAGLSISSVVDSASSSSAAAAAPTAAAAASSKGKGKRKGKDANDTAGSHVSSAHNSFVDAVSRRPSGAPPAQRPRLDDRPGRYENPSPADERQHKFFLENVLYCSVNGQNAVSIKGVPGTFKRAELQTFREKHGWPCFHYPLVRGLPNWKQYIRPGILAKPHPLPELTASQKKELEALRETSEGATIGPSF